MSELGAWEIFKGTGEPHPGLTGLPLPPPWRRSSAQETPTPPPSGFALDAEKERGAPYQVDPDVRRAVNAALYLRRPLFVMGKPGVGKSTLAAAVAYELQMGPVLRWSINSRSTARNGEYQYDAVGRLHAQQTNDPSTLGDFLRLGPLGSALYPTTWPRTLLIDEIDKGDLDLPNDLLSVLEEGYFEIPELTRATEPETLVRIHDSDKQVPIKNGRVQCRQFPFVVITSNGEREFPAPFLRRCIRITIAEPTADQLTSIINAHLEEHLSAVEKPVVRRLIDDFVRQRSTESLATDQLLNALFLVLGDGRDIVGKTREDILKLVLEKLSTPQPT